MDHCCRLTLLLGVIIVWMSVSLAGVSELRDTSILSVHPVAVKRAPFYNLFLSAVHVGTDGNWPPSPPSVGLLAHNLYIHEHLLTLLTSSVKTEVAFTSKPWVTMSISTRCKTSISRINTNEHVTISSFTRNISQRINVVCFRHIIN
jgi:hypothetical protein